MGEGLPAMFPRCGQVWVAASGSFSLPPLTALPMTFGADQAMSPVDHPFQPERTRPSS